MKGSAEPHRARGGRKTLYQLYVADARSVNRRRETAVTTHDLVTSHLFYVIQVAKEYRNLGIPFEDLMSEGNVGLMEAARRFDRTRGVKFISYATWWIRKRMWDLVARQVSLVRIPKYRLEQLRRLRQVERDLRFTLGRNPTTDEIARSAALSPAEVEALFTQSQREISLDTIVNIDSGLRLEELVAEKAAAPPDGGLVRERTAASLLRFLDHLPRRQKEILSMHYGLRGEKVRTLAEIGRILGVSRERVRQLERQGLTRMRRLMDMQGRAAVV
jgi:RNA polymerase sigma factor (sigma-70 family)